MKIISANTSFMVWKKVLKVFLRAIFSNRHFWDHSSKHNKHILMTKEGINYIWLNDCLNKEGERKTLLHVWSLIVSTSDNFLCVWLGTKWCQCETNIYREPPKSFKRWNVAFFSYVNFNKKRNGIPFIKNFQLLYYLNFHCA